MAGDDGAELLQMLTALGETLAWGLFVNDEELRRAVESWRKRPGPWQQEHDGVGFVHCGVRCTIERNPVSGTWCGYAAVVPGSRYHGVELEEVELQVHGGVTFSGFDAQSGDEETWWVGFDCGHRPQDYIPLLMGPELGPTYRTARFAEEQTRRLAEQLAEN